MFAELADAIRTLVVPVDERGLRTLLALRDEFEGRVSDAVGEFDAAFMFELSGALSMRSWLVDEGVAGPDAAITIRIARRLRRCPVLSGLWVAGEVSRGQVRVIDAHLTDRTLGHFVDIEATLAPLLVGLSIAETVRVMDEWRARVAAEFDPDGLPPEPERTLHHSQTLDGRWLTNGAFDLEAGVVVDQALALASVNDFDRNPAERRADALVDIARFFLDHHATITAGGGRRSPHVNLVVDAHDLTRGSFAGGEGELDAATVSRYLCDCRISRVVATKVAGAVSRVLDVGHSTETVTGAQRNALYVRDRHCRFAGCERPASWCDAHHVLWWSRGGPTDLSNLVLLCRRHHSMIHRRDLQCTLRADGTFIVVDPVGRQRVTKPPGTLPLWFADPPDPPAAAA